MTEPRGLPDESHHAPVTGPASPPVKGRAASVATRADEKPPMILISDELFASCDEVIILHGNQRYRLRRTRNNKLILYK
ncbi:MAG: hemin uptake protein HemP [Planctomycetes bacterium]|nr:hemin uptake protein HemP [Planctomycetota bacterium]